MRKTINCWMVVFRLFLFTYVFATIDKTNSKSSFKQCETIVKKWASSSQEFEVFEDQKTLKDLLFFLHVPRTGGKNYFHCFLEKLYDPSSKCPLSYDELRFDPRNPGCNLTVTHDDYSLMSKLPYDKTSVVTVIRNPVDRVFSSYEFSVEVAARSLMFPNLTYATEVANRRPVSVEKLGGNTLDIWPWKYLAPWMIEDLFARKNMREVKGENLIKTNEPYNMGDIVMPLHQFINDPIALDLVHNGATFQVAGLTNNSYSKESNDVRKCVLKYQTLGEYVLEVAKRRLDGMLYIGLTDKHKESAALFASVVGDQVISKLAQSRFSVNGSTINHSKLIDPFRNSSSKTETTRKLVKLYEGCIQRSLESQRQRRASSVKYITPVNFTQESRHQVPKRIIEEIGALNNLDMQLYEYAQLIFEKQKQTGSKKVITEVMSYGMLNALYVTSWKHLPFALPFLLLLPFIFIYVSSRTKRSKSKL
ncbi:unnamed protein product [Cuscuta epithymum]|uniref:Sulfotransferase n=1 Tax=Cuscuta epithymum TaxID=186058 RepID=A0AAV0CDI4_9ASTE|nr:unnamed protein product [Cuscuta epithymum]